MNTTRHSTRTLVLVATAVTAFGVVAAPVQTASAQPKEQPSVTHRHHRSTACADNLRELTEKYRQAGMSAQASHIAAQLALGC